MTGKAYPIEIEGTTVIINLTATARRQIAHVLALSEYPVYGTLLAMGKTLLDMADKTYFVIIDEDQCLGVIGVKDSSTMAVDVIAVVDKADIMIKRGLRVFKYDSKEEQGGK